MDQKDELAQDHKLTTEDLLNAGPGEHEHGTTSHAVPGFDRDGEDPDRDDLHEADHEGLDRNLTDENRTDDDLDDDDLSDERLLGERPGDEDRADEGLDDEGLHSANPDRVHVDNDVDEDDLDRDVPAQGHVEPSAGDLAEEPVGDEPVASDLSESNLDEPAVTEPAGTEPVAAAAAEPVATGAKPTPTKAGDDAGTPLFAADQVDQYRTQWREVQSAFVDSPQQAVQEADELVAQVIQNLAATFAEHKRTLEAQWDRGEAGETEDLRLALRQYRSFFNQLLSVQ